MDGSVLQVHQAKDKTYLYTLNPSPIHHKSNKIDHYLKIVDFYIQAGMPEKCIIEPIFGKYEPDLFYTNAQGKNICVEIQLTLISNKKMQQKINQFVSEYNINHTSNIIYICTNNTYKKLKIPKDFTLKMFPIPTEKCFKN
jgi:hypothetical protein